MNTYQISVNQNEDLSWIIQAAQELAVSTESDMKAIKAKKWYDQLLETITFSQGDKIQTAKDIGTLAKLQEIVIRILVMLSQENAAISTVVREQTELLKGLQIQDAALLTAIKKIKFGGTDQLSFAELPKEIKALLANLVVMADQEEERNDYSRRYIASIMRIAGIGMIDNTLHVEAVESLDKKQQELLYQMIMINRYLRDIDADEDDDVIDCISISPKRAKQICAAIESTAENVAPDFFATYYEAFAEDINVIDDKDIAFVSAEIFSEHKEDTKEKYSNQVDTDPASKGTRFTIKSSANMENAQLMDVPAGETRVYENRIFHINGGIHCAGVLRFVNCILHYGETANGGEIVIDKGGKLLVERCRIEGHSSADKYLIIAKDDAKETEFIDCYFVNCNYLLDTHEDARLDYCTVDSGCIYFVNMSQYQNANIRILNSAINYMGGPNVLVDLADRERKSMIVGNSVHLSECSFKGDLSIDSAEMAYEIENYRRALIDAKNLFVQDTQFAGIKTLLESEKAIISHCIFSQCCGIVCGGRYRSEIDVLECRFEQCTQIGYGSGGDIKYAMSQFNDCYNRLIAHNFVGGVVIDLCQFNRWTTNKNNKTKYMRTDAMLKFERANKSDYRKNVVSNCTFNDMHANNYFVIMGEIYENIFDYVVEVKRCTFTNCTTGRCSGKLIKEYGRYFGLFNREIEKMVVDVSFECTGWEKVKID